MNFIASPKFGFVGRGKSGKDVVGKMRMCVHVQPVLAGVGTTDTWSVYARWGPPHSDEAEALYRMCGFFETNGINCMDVFFRGMSVCLSRFFADLGSGPDELSSFVYTSMGDNESITNLITLTRQIKSNSTLDISEAKCVNIAIFKSNYNLSTTSVTVEDGRVFDSSRATALLIGSRCVSTPVPIFQKNAASLTFAAIASGQKEGGERHLGGGGSAASSAVSAKPNHSKKVSGATAASVNEKSINTRSGGKRKDASPTLSDLADGSPRQAKHSRTSDRGVSPSASGPSLVSRRSDVLSSTKQIHFGNSTKNYRKRVEILEEQLSRMQKSMGGLNGSFDMALPPLMAGVFSSSGFHMYPHADGSVTSFPCMSIGQIMPTPYSNPTPNSICKQRTSDFQLGGNAVATLGTTFGANSLESEKPSLAKDFQSWSRAYSPDLYAPIGKMGESDEDEDEDASKGNEGCSAEMHGIDSSFTSGRLQSSSDALQLDGVDFSDMGSVLGVLPK